MSTTSPPGRGSTDRAGEERYHRVDAPTDARQREAEARHAAEIERLQARLREVEAERDEAKRAAEWLSRAGGAPQRRFARGRQTLADRFSPRRARLAGPLAFLAVLAAAAVAIAMEVTADDRPGKLRPAAPDARERSTAAVPANLPPCSRAIREGVRRVTCRTGSGKALTVAGFGQPVLLGDIQVRAMGTTRLGDGLTVRLRIRNESDARQVLERNPRNLYLSVAGRRITGVDVEGPRVLPPGEAETVNVAFQLDAEVSAALDRTGGADLGVLDFSGRGERLGVARIGVDPATDAAG